MAEEKDELRSRYRRARKDKFVPATYSLLLSTPEITSAKTVASYVSYGDEPTTQELNQSLLARGITLLLPRVSGSELSWVQWFGNDDALEKRANILEPIGPSISDLLGIDVVIVPALQIDRNGFRLGQGGGFYDRALPMMSGWKVGLVHSAEITSELLPREVHDVQLDAAATPEIVVRFSNKSSE
ncbi:unannotated protein [freshwater metagenome]|uniref:Unannotated protein n=1 Tax=freshwater metagenome TaxID=449393 RepID=A0A6J7UZS5_9ZZZZ|nr:5-formyltetrahydrofolate cyclo-ligase [Actinomycetota bacterium]MSW26597.1 5-formyltetrahydrofolate cyclo-ligase [Actinomycetota bacterium]MSW34292.1 5-formyltetrahydrofolate cyclo-ligase [Actinomycetota bacterium]MSX31697.1 5-formyltetrahydrofolate cyclo-ligase [Actinomycetota bacterium]MSX51635.1 5-formyltetrahydrofolate cyclo-ligase [Actinomycetota bacterium]